MKHWRSGKHLARRAAWWSALAATVLAGTAVAVTAAAAPVAAACTTKSEPSLASAVSLAKSCSKSVLVAAATTETSTLSANDNGTVTAEESVVPERVLRADGSWVAVDTTLKSNGDGTISPTASPTAVVLSGGGKGPLAKTASQSQELVWTWTGMSLPKPSLSGSVATYADVLPDVDLKIRVDEWGFSEVLVVKTAAAAANPALASLQFALSGSGLTAAGAAGLATVPDTAVSDAFDIGDAHMWDSSAPATKPSASMPAEDVQSETVSTFDGPGSGAKTATAPTSMNGTTLVVTPVQSLLNDPTAKFPIYIDPKSSSPARSYWAMINEGHTSQEYWDYDRSDHAKVGNAGDGTNMYRSLFQFSTSAWQNKHVTAVTFSDNLLHSWSCSNTTTELHLSSQTLSKSTTWSSNASSWGSSLATVSNQNCNDASGVASEWSSSALTSAVNSAHANATITIGLRAASETISTDGSNGWKKFDETSGSGGAHLSVTYNTAPVLSNLYTDGGTCATTAASAPTLTTAGSPAHNPVPQVTVTDAETDKSTVVFTYPKSGGGTTTTTYANVASGTTQKLSTGIPAAGIPTGSTYSWSVSVSDGTDSTSKSCYFKIDNTPPVAPTIVSTDGVYPVGTDDNVAYGGVGKPGTFTISAGGATNIVKYAWGPDPGTLQTVTTTSGAPVTVSFTPTTEGLNKIQAYAYTTTGIQSSQTAVDFKVDTQDSEAGSWLLNGDGTDAGSGKHDATATNVTWTDNARQTGQKAAHFDGASSVLTATAPIHTNTSFAVSAWLRPSGTSCTTNAVGQDGTVTSGFYLGCYGGKFTFDVIPSDSATVASVRTVSTATAPIGVWTNVLGVYDLSSNKISLYVNGTLQATNTLTVPLWDAKGSFVIGRQRYNSANGSWWAGDISDVRAWDRVIYPADISTALTAASWADQYPLDSTADPTSDTQGGNANPLTWRGSPEPVLDDMNPPGNGGTFGSTLSSVDPDYALSAKPSVHTDGSFSVSAWVQPSTIGTTYTDAVSQNGIITSNFGLGVSSSGNYDFWMHGSDTTSPTTSIIQSTSPAIAGQFVNLIATFDATTKQMTLYVNGDSQGSVAFTGTPWQSNGPLAVGAGLLQSNLSYLWDGGIDYVSMFNGVLNTTQIANDYQYNNPFYVAAPPA